MVKKCSNFEVVLRNLKIEKLPLNKFSEIICEQISLQVKVGFKWKSFSWKDLSNKNERGAFLPKSW